MLLLFLLLILFSTLTASSLPSSPYPLADAPSGNGTTVYDLLPRYGLPPGLLPDSVTSFSLAENGEFEVDLAGPCYIQFDYLIYYSPKITGVVKYGGIQDLKGIQVRRFFVWFDVDAIRVDLPPASYIYFQVGWINRQLNVDQFQTVRSCQNDGVADRVRAAVKDVIQLPEPLREIEMLLTE